MNFQRKKVAIALGIGGVALVAGGTASAQDIRVNVTGTNIKRVDSETSAPIETITREDIQASGLQTIQEVVRAITANNNGSIAPSFTNGFSASGTAVSLRGLGPNNTLVLVNGRRLANFGLADDGHASYPDLAPAPVRRRRAHRNPEGRRVRHLRLRRRGGRGQRDPAPAVHRLHRNGDGRHRTTTARAATSRSSATGGIGDLTKDKYNAFLSVDYQKSDAIPEQYRPRLHRQQRPAVHGPGGPAAGQHRTTDTTSCLGNVRPVNPTTGGSPGAFQSLPGNCDPVNQSEGFCQWEPKDWTDSDAEIERFNVYGRGAYNFTPDIQGYTEVSFFQVKTNTRNTPTGTRANWYDPSVPQVAVVGQHLPAGRPPGQPVQRQQPGRAPVLRDAALGGRDADYKTDTQRYLLGLKGTSAGWDWDMAGLYIKSDTDVTRKNFYSYDRLLQGTRRHGPVRLLPDRRERQPEQPGDLRLDRAGPRVEHQFREHDLRRQGLARHLQARRAGNWRWPSATST